MKNKRPPVASQLCDLLILPGGRILAHNLSRPLAGVPAELNPADGAMSRRAARKNTLKHDLSN